MHNRYSPWDEPGVMEALLALSALRHYSAAEIAVKLSKQFKVSISRGSVIGKMFRENIPLRGKKSRPTLSSPYAKRPAKAPAQAKAPKPIKVDPSEPKPLGDVPCGCRFLRGDALARNFCGAEAFEGPWCEYHRKIVFSRTAQEVPNGNSKRAA